MTEIKRLQKSTIRRYNAKQLAKHLDRIMIDITPKYRVDLQYGQILEINASRDAYVFRCSIIEQNRRSIVDMILETYKRHGF